MQLLLTYVCFFLGAALTAKGQQANATAANELVAKLLVQSSHVERLKLLQDQDFAFDFTKGVGLVSGSGGKITLATQSNFPALVGNDLAMAVAVFAPCGLNNPHSHPRAAEFLYVLNGTSMLSGFIEENGARYVTNSLPSGSGTVYPKGSIHFQQNLGCEPAAFVAVLNHADPGVFASTQLYFGLPPAVIEASLDVSIQEVELLAMNIPDRLSIGVQECLTRCGITPGTQSHSQLFPRVSGNAFPPSSSAKARRTEKRSIARRSVDVPIEDETKPTGSVESIGDKEMVSTLRIFVGIMLVGYVLVGVNWIRRRRRAQRTTFDDMIKA